MAIIPHLPLHMDSIALFGLTLLLGLVGGELTRRTHWLPRILGYIAVGYFVGPHGINIVNETLLADTRLFVDISLSLILFELGRHLDVNWLRQDKGLLAMAIAESSLTWVLIFIVLCFIVGLPWQSSALAAAIAIATAPAVIMLIVHDLNCQGPVTRRTLILTSLNNLFALTLFILLLPFVVTKVKLGLPLLGFSIYRLVGSVILGLVMFVLATLIARLTGKHKESQFVLFVGMVVFTIGTAHTLNLSTMFSLFVLGVAARNLDYKHRLMEVDFGWLARVFFILLFVVTGVNLKLQGLWLMPEAVILFLAARFMAKMTGVWLFRKASRLTKQQAYVLGLSLFPMANMAVGMSNILLDYNPVLGQQLLLIVTTCVAITTLIGAIITQVAMLKINEGVLPSSVGEE